LLLLYCLLIGLAVAKPIPIPVPSCKIIVILDGMASSTIASLVTGVLYVASRPDQDIIGSFLHKISRRPFKLPFGWASNLEAYFLKRQLPLQYLFLCCFFFITDINGSGTCQCNNQELKPIK
jgi:hypothetical protein